MLLKMTSEPHRLTDHRVVDLGSVYTCNAVRNVTLLSDVRVIAVSLMKYKNIVWYEQGSVCTCNANRNVILFLFITNHALFIWHICLHFYCLHTSTNFLYKNKITETSYC